MSESKVAVVTGSNKGIGYAIVRGLCKNFHGDVYLTARDVGRGQKAIESLKKEGLIAKFHQLDITDKASIEKLKNFLQSNYGGLDILVNNAAIAYKQDSTASFGEQAEVSIKTNYTGTLDVCEVLFPLLRPHARVVNVSSFVSGMVIKKCSKEIQLQFTDQNLTIEQLSRQLQDFVDAAKAGTHQKKGYANSAYGMSKVGVSALTQIQGRQLKSDAREDIIVNSACPGYVKTDMTSQRGGKTPDQGADTPLYLALLPPGTTKPKADFVSERKIVKWYA